LESVSLSHESVWTRQADERTMLVVEKERPGRIHLIFVDENIGS
jgi:hypothetical protein